MLLNYSCSFADFYYEISLIATAKLCEHMIAQFASFFMYETFVDLCAVFWQLAFATFRSCPPNTPHIIYTRQHLCIILVNNQLSRNHTMCFCMLWSTTYQTFQPCVLFLTLENPRKQQSRFRVAARVDIATSERKRVVGSAAFGS